jgi:hypothetical protein
LKASPSASSIGTSDKDSGLRPISSTGSCRLVKENVFSNGRSFPPGRIGSPTECWSLNGDTIRIILGVCDGSLTNYGNGQEPEDWRFYREGELFLGFVSHERYAFLRLTENELDGSDVTIIGRAS